MNILVSLIINAIVIFVTANILPGVHIADFQTALIAAVVLGVINTLLKPILMFLTLPITILTLGLFTLIINGLLVLLATHIVPGFRVDGFLWAIIFSIVVSIINAVVNKFPLK